ncbi:MAG: hypothetical protein ABIS03_07140 [Gemmatimonadaceae bacterium]
MGILGFPLLPSPTAAYACSKIGFPGVRHAREAHFIAVPTSDTVLAGAGNVKYVLAPGHFGPRGDRTVYGQRLRVERIGGLASRLLRQGVSEVVVVPWDYGADCRPVPWTRSSVWLQPNERGLITATLRDSAFWANGIPTLDVHTPNMQPYPQRVEQQLRRRNLDPDALMSLDDVFLLMEILPYERELTDSAEKAVEPLFQWARANPDMARRHPAVEALSRARYAANGARLRRIRSPLIGTYRISFRMGDRPIRSFYARSQAIPVSYWTNLLAPLPQADDPTLVVQPPGYYLQLTGAVNSSDLPETCVADPDPKNFSDGFIAVLDRPPLQVKEGLQWPAKVELELLGRVFADDPELRQFIKDAFQHSYQRRKAGISRTDDLPARFTRASSGAIQFEQTIALDDGRQIVVSGGRISTATISCNRT